MLSKGSRNWKRSEVAVEKCLLTQDNALPTYGSLVSHNKTLFDTEAPTELESSLPTPSKEQERPCHDKMSSKNALRCITVSEVVLPPVKWYKRLYIPGLTHSRPSPFSNVIRTTKYTILNFPVKNLWEQFHRFANLYFLLIPILNFIPAIGAVGKEVAFIPILFILSVTAAKDIFEDYRRYKSDRTVNKKLCRVYDR